LLVIPAKAGIQFFLGFALQSKASTPPSAERVTSFFARAKKKVTKKETRWPVSQVLSHARRRGREPSRYPDWRAKIVAVKQFFSYRKQYPDLVRKDDAQILITRVIAT
jgi:hypothetical protein